MYIHVEFLHIIINSSFLHFETNGVTRAESTGTLSICLPSGFRRVNLLKLKLMDSFEPRPHISDSEAKITSGIENQIYAELNQDWGVRLKGSKVADFTPSVLTLDKSSRPQNYFRVLRVTRLSKCK